MTTLAGVAVVTLMLGAPNSARAELAIFASEAGVNGGAFTMIAGDLSSGSDFGAVSFTGSYGTFNLTINSVSSDNGVTFSDLLGSTNKIVNTSASTATIKIAVLQNNYTMPTGNLSVESGLGGSINAGSVTMAGIFEAHYNTTNSTSLNGFPLTNGSQNGVQSGSTFQTGSAFGVLGPRTGNSPYAVESTTTLTVTSGGSLNYSNHVNLTALPEPGTVAMALTALPLFGFALARRRRARA